MRYKKAAITLISIAFIAVLWELIAWKVNFPAIFPPLKDLLKELFLLFQTRELYLAVSTTVYRGIIGIFVAFICSFTLATLAAFSDFWKTFFQPIIVILRSVPVISFVLLALLWFSPNQLPIFIALITVFPILYQSILTAFSQTDTRLIEVGKVFGKTPLNRFVTIYLPSSKNIIYDGLSTALGFAWRAIIIGEVLARPIHGIGSGMKEAQAFIQVPKLMAWTIIAIGVSYFFDFLLQQIRKVKIANHYPAPQEFNLIQKESFDIIELTIADISKQFNQQLIFSNYSDSFTNKNINCIKGLSGQGKTTLLRIISTLDSEYKGTVNLSDKHSISYAFQDNRLFPWLTVQENINYSINKKQFKKQEISNISSYLMNKLSLYEYKNKYPHQLSGGQQQRVNLARALAAQSNILLLDEPLTGLDAELKKQIIEFLLQWIEVYRPIVIWATHENIIGKENLHVIPHQL